MTDATVDAIATEPKVDSPRRRFWRRLLRNPLAIVSLVWLLILVVAWVWPELIATRDPLRGDPSLVDIFQGPSTEYWLGTDGFGRDYFSRIVFGAGYAFRSILIAMTIAVGFGVPIGLVSGWMGGRVDRAFMWVNDVIFSLPIVLLAFAVIMVLEPWLFSSILGEPTLVSAMVGVGVAMLTRFARLTRAVTLAEKEELYVDAARITGLSTPRILGKYIAPNLLPALIVQIAIISGAIILIGATLSFLGVGASQDAPDWGVMLSRSRIEFRQEGVWQIIAPALPLVLTVLSFNLLGDAIRDALGRDVSSNALTVTKRKVIAPIEEPLPDDADVVLSIRDMDVEFPSPSGRVSQILQGVSLDVRAGETLGVVGESGSGKSMTMLSALGLTPAPGQMTGGTVRFDGRDVTNLSERDWQQIRGKDIGFIFQEPIAVLNPAIKVGSQIMEPLRIHLGMDKREARERAAELLAEVRVPDPHRRLDQHPHEFSGGMAQRVGIAMALACGPKLLIADEPSTALDVTVQGQILDLMAEIQEARNMAIILITHDLGVIAEVADRVLVMYGGQVVETSSAQDLFYRPRHPYSRALLDTMPQSHDGHGELPVIRGMVPSATAWPAGCRFAPRCSHAIDDCTTSMPELRSFDSDKVRCLRAGQIDLRPAPETPVSTGPREEVVS